MSGAWPRGKVRANSAVDLLLNALPGAPVATVQSAATLIGRSEQAVNEAVPRLVDAGVLTQTTVGRRNRAFEALDLINAFTDLERQLASPDGDTLHSPPQRRVPQRPPPRYG
jgi:DNA-binding Lrp family transcriptional regulator